VTAFLSLLPFFGWIPLAALAVARTREAGSARALWMLSGLTFVLCGCMLYLEFIWSRHVVNPIRVDLLLLIPLTTMTFTGIGVWGLRRRGALAKAASVVLIASCLPTLAVFLRGMWAVNRDMARLDQRPALIFEAQFRNPQTFRSFFGDIETGRETRAGHFRAETTDGALSRAIINDHGHMWLLMTCGANVECVHSEADLSTIRFSAWTPDRFTLSVSAAITQTFVRAPVPYHEAAAVPATVTFVGTFSQTRRDRDYVYLVQAWLWRSGDRWLAYYTRRNAQCGSTNDFVVASPYIGKAIGEEVFFDPTDGGNPIETFHIMAAASPADRIDGEVVYSGHPLEKIALDRRAVLRSPIYDSAPIVDFDATVAWLSIVSMGYFMTWQVGC